MKISTAEIAKIMNREHKNVVRFAKLKCEYTESTYKDAVGRIKPCLMLDEANASIVVSTCGRLDFYKERIPFIKQVSDLFVEKQRREDEHFADFMANYRFDLDKKYQQEKESKKCN